MCYSQYTFCDNNIANANLPEDSSWHPIGLGQIFLSAEIVSKPQRFYVHSFFPFFFFFLSYMWLSVSVMYCTYQELLPWLRETSLLARRTSVLLVDIDKGTNALAMLLPVVISYNTEQPSKKRFVSFLLHFSMKSSCENCPSKWSVPWKSWYLHEQKICTSTHCQSPVFFFFCTTTTSQRD